MKIMMHVFNYAVYSVNIMLTIWSLFLKYTFYFTVIHYKLILAYYSISNNYLSLRVQRLSIVCVNKLQEMWDISVHFDFLKEFNQYATKEWHVSKSYKLRQTRQINFSKINQILDELNNFVCSKEAMMMFFI